MKPDTTISHYRIRASLGAGGMGEVFLAEDTKLHRKVAIKLLLPSLASGGTGSKRLLREARAAAALDHPNICAIYEVAEDDGRMFIVMQYVEGETLQARMRRGPLPFLEVLSTTRQVVDALSEAHAHDTIHRDIKPANIMISARGLVKVMDFGLATSGPGGANEDADTMTGLTSPGSVLGTVPYMSPEQVRGEPLDARSDLFSVGVVLYELVTGHQPFAAPSSAGTLSAILTEDPQPLARYSKDATTELERIVFKALRKDREERYQTAKDLLIDVRALEDEVRRLSSGARSGHVGGTPISGTSPVVVAPVATTPSAAVPTEPTPTDAPPHRATGRAIRWRGGVAAVTIIVVASAGFWFYRARSQAAWARAQIPRIESLVEVRDLGAAYDLAIEARRHVPTDPTLIRLMPIVSDLLSVATEPAGATVYLTRLTRGEPGQAKPRQRVGVTPIEKLEIARGSYLLAIERAGYAPVELPITGTTDTSGRDRYLSPPVRIVQTLMPAGAVPERMVFVPGGDYRLVAWGRPTEARPRLGDYFIDKYEVRNQDFREFVTAGGYLKKEYWKHPFVENGRVLPWEDAMKALTDRTGLPGPRSWSSQVFPPGLADHPVTSVSWYEAAAYAAFRGKELPTVFQWEKAARNGNASAPFDFMPWGPQFPGDSLQHRANFGGATTMPVTANPFGASPFGAYNMAGNVAEWCQNDSTAGFITTGGAFGDPTYMFAQFGTYPGFYTSDRLGFRCARRRAPERVEASAMRIEILSEVPKFVPATAARVDTLRSYYRYEKTALSPTVVETTATPDWQREKVTFAGADGERAIAYLYLPIHAARPVQVIHFLPGTGVELGVMDLQSRMEAVVGPCVRAGRAIFGVALRGYHERRGAGGPGPAQGTAEFRDKIVNWVTDLRRGLDYLETRPDVDASRIAFVAESSGARNGITLAAIESRYRSVFFQGAGVSRAQAAWVEGTSPIDFAPHIKGPTMMFQGRHDEAIRLKTQAEPLFALLPEPKRLVLYDGGHMAPAEALVRELNGWLDQTLGPVKR